MIRREHGGVHRYIERVRHRGTTVLCPLCGGRWTGFKDDWNRADALCWRCGSHERHRAQWLLFESRPELLGSATRLLHFAPEYCLRRRLVRAGLAEGFTYVTADLDPRGVDLSLDITGMDLPDGAFDAVVCSHVLEHVADDRAAMRELRRITQLGGWCLVSVPLDLTRKHTHEDSAMSTEQDRLREFWQADHVRLYAPDIEGRLAAAGFEVEVIRPAEAFGMENVETCRLLTSDWIFLCR